MLFDTELVNTAVVCMRLVDVVSGSGYVSRPTEDYAFAELTRKARNGEYKSLGTSTGGNKPELRSISGLLKYAYW